MSIVLFLERLLTVWIVHNKLVAYEVNVTMQRPWYYKIGLKMPGLLRHILSPDIMIYFECIPAHVNSKVGIWLRMNIRHIICPLLNVEVMPDVGLTKCKICFRNKQGKNPWYIWLRNRFKLYIGKKIN